MIALSAQNGNADVMLCSLCLLLLTSTMYMLEMLILQANLLAHLTPHCCVY